MSLLNYTTQIETAKTIGEIQRMLAKAKASAILTEYDKDGIEEALSFKVPTEFGVMTFRLPSKIDRILAVLQRDRKIANRLKTKEQATRVAWRIVKDGLAAQLAWVEAGLVTIEAIFLAYAQDHEGLTLHDKLLSKRMDGLALPYSE